ncbi:protein of unknown function [Bradyrhizobium vignae]|uniref:Uncharacterized protein n=1 Tax=Bradyrhizobium vignae TaxID=1549949 RepID=A0A2U3Q0G6_9BRAD|nr:protein of unknown function [Bradyrhizobium vignae]
MRLAVIVQILVADDLADGLLGPAGDPVLKTFGLAHELPPICPSLRARAASPAPEGGVSAGAAVPSKLPPATGGRRKR